MDARDADEGLTLDRLLVYVERALRGDRRLQAQLLATMRQLAVNPGAPEEERALGEALARVLHGERRPDLSRLDPEAAAEVGKFLSRLGEDRGKQ